MPNALSVALSGQIAVDRRLESIAANIANAGTVGYRADKVVFSSLIDRAGQESISFATSRLSDLDRRSGEIKETGNAFDVAVEGDAWLAISTPSGTAYTRNGRLSMSTLGELRSIEGYPILDAGGSPVNIDPKGDAPRIDRRGQISQGDRVVGTIGLFMIEPEQRLTRFGNTAVMSCDEPALVQDFSANGLTQGFLEGANVNPIRELTNLMMVSRSFEALSSAISETEKRLSGAIAVLGR